MTDAEEARAAELEAAIVAEEREAEEAQRRTRTRRAATDEPSGATSSLAAADEYAYVARDVRRIAVVGGSLVAFLFGLWAVAHITGIGPF